MLKLCREILGYCELVIKKKKMCQITELNIAKLLDG